MRRATATVLFGLLAAPAIASDAANSVVIGYSADGRFFAFEQFGVQDGSGFPYADVFVLDLHANSWVDGTPLRALIENESATAGQARARVAALAAPVLKKFDISEPGEVLASTPATEVQAERTTMTFDLHYRHMGGAEPLPASDLWSTRAELKMSFSDIHPVPAHCVDFGEAVKGLKITITDLKTGQSLVAHEDKTIPKSRGCPKSYDFDKAVIPASHDEATWLAVLVGVYSYGFEGQDRRYIAVPIKLR